MDTVEVRRNALRDIPRLARATALLLAGAAVHLWLFPFPATPGQSRLLETLTAGVTTVAREGAGAAEDTAGVVASALGGVVPSPTATNGRVAKNGSAETSNRVKVLIESVHPTTIPSPIPASRPRFGNAVFRTVLAPDPAVGERFGPALVPGEPAISAELPAIEHAPEPHALDTPVRQPRPLVSSLLIPDVVEPGARAAHTPGHGNAAARVEGPSDERLVGYVLQQYREAYESLDVTAAQTVWPTVDARALGAAFRQLAGQRVTFDSCGVSVSGSGSQATARCTGQAEYVPKVGSRRAYTASGEWVFDLQKENTAWRIINANANIK